MATRQSLRNRVLRVESALGLLESAGFGFDAAVQLKAARQRAQRVRRGEEPAPVRVPIDVDACRTWAAKRLAERLNRARARMHERGCPGYEAFAGLVVRLEQR